MIRTADAQFFRLTGRPERQRRSIPASSPDAKVLIHRRGFSRLASR
jgi:hypothetical protein